MTKITSKLLFFIVLTLFFACDELLSVDISDREVIVVSPHNNSLLTDNEVRFLWEPVDDATYYHLQIVEPEFEFAERFLIDTIIYKNSLIIKIAQGNYEWRILGSNEFYSTAYQYLRFSVEVDTTGITEN